MGREKVCGLDVVFVVVVCGVGVMSSVVAAFGEEDRVVNLPGQPSLSISHFSGYVNVSQDRALFYWFFQALDQPLNNSKPLLLWLNGGPGCSSIGYGEAVEIGPLKVNQDGTGLVFNNFTWLQEANLLFLESPVGVGFSYTNQTSDLTNLDDKFVAEDAYSFLMNWMEKFPQLKSNDFFIAGESYGGHYIPQLAELIYDRNKTQSSHFHVNLKGFIVGNPETDSYYDNKGLLEYSWSHAVISDDEYDKAKQECDFKAANWTSECNAALNVVFDAYREIDIYNIYAPICVSTSNTTSKAYTMKRVFEEGKIVGMRVRMDGGYDACYSAHVEAYFNREDVRSSLHSTNSTNMPINDAKWKVCKCDRTFLKMENLDQCSSFILNNYKSTVDSMLPTYQKLIKGGLKIWIYSGDADGRVPVIGTRYWVEALGLHLATPWRSWYHLQQVGGRVSEYEGLTLVTVRGAGHLVPLNKPSESLALIHSFLYARPLPSHN